MLELLNPLRDTNYNPLLDTLLQYPSKLSRQTSSVLASSSSNERSYATVLLLLLLFLLLLPGIPGIVSGNRATMRRPANDNEGWKAGRKGDQHIRCLQCVREGVRIKQAIVKMAPKKKSQNKVYGSCCNLPGRGNHVHRLRVIGGHSAQI